MWSRIIGMGCLLILLIDNHHSFVDTAPLDNHSGKENKKDEEVEELESLKKDFERSSSVGKQMSMSKVSSSVYSNVNGHKISHGEMKAHITKNGKPLMKISEKIDAVQEENGEPKVKSSVELDIPSKNIHKSILKEGGNIVGNQGFSSNEKRRSDASFENGIYKINSYSGLEYTPLDMAEYIFWTGDEKGVIMAIEEFLEEGLMSREEAINFLQSIKNNLDYMQEHFHGLQKTENGINKDMRQQSIGGRAIDAEKSANLDYDVQESEKTRVDSYDVPANKYVTPKEKASGYQPPETKPFGRYRNILKEKNNGNVDLSNERKKRFKEVKDSSRADTKSVRLSDEEFQELLERLSIVDFLYSEYSLEEIIYQLAKVVFSQSLTRGSNEVELALQRFTTFLDKEARLGQISRNLEKKILDLLMAALTDTLTEHPQLLSAVKENANDFDFPSLPSRKNQLDQSEENLLAGRESNVKSSGKELFGIQNKEPEKSKN